MGYTVSGCGLPWKGADCLPHGRGDDLSEAHYKGALITGELLYTMACIYFVILLSSHMMMMLLLLLLDRGGHGRRGSYYYYYLSSNNKIII